MNAPAVNAPTASVARPKVQVDISHRYGTLEVHQGLRFDVRENEFLCIAGPSGCGKTTLLDILCGLLAPSEGKTWRPILSSEDARFGGGGTAFPQADGAFLVPGQTTWVLTDA